MRPFAILPDGLNWAVHERDPSIGWRPVHAIDLDVTHTPWIAPEAPLVVLCSSDQASMLPWRRAAPQIYNRHLMALLHLVIEALLRGPGPGGHATQVAH